MDVKNQLIAPSETFDHKGIDFINKGKRMWWIQWL